jgi:hypothetical protein
MAVAIRRAGSNDREAIWGIIEPINRAGDARLRLSIGSHPTAASLSRKKAARSSALIICAPIGPVPVRMSLMPVSWSRTKRAARAWEALCEHALNTAKARGFTAMQFNFVVAANDRAVRLWQRMGFAEIGRAPEAFRHARLGLVDALVMHRKL